VVRSRFSEKLALRVALMAWLIASFALASAGAQALRYDGQVIQEIEYRGLQGLPSDTMEHYLFGRPTEEPRRLDIEELNRQIKRLWDRELIDDIQIEVEPVDGGVKLVIQAVERPILVSIDYVGIKRVSRSDINEQIDRERISVYESQPLSVGELQRLKGAIEDLYKEKGYRFAEVGYSLETVSAGQRRVNFSIDEGDKVKIGDISFDGNTIFGDWRLRRAMGSTKESGLISRISKKDIYNPATIDEDLENLRDLYRKAGYKDVLIAKPEIDVVVKNPGASSVKDQKRRLAVTVPVEEGERWRLGEIRIEGSEVFSDQVLLRQFEKPRGGWLRSKTIDAALENIDKLYKSIGYIFAEISTELEERDSNVADLILTVNEQDQFRVGRMEFEGNAKTRDKVLRREMFLQEGNVMNMSSVQNSLLRIRQLNYFALDEEEPVKFDFNAEEKTVDLKVVGDEAERTELQFGGGWSEIDGFFGQFAIRTTNFLGRGETLGVSVQAGGRRNLFDIEYRIPWFLNRPQNFSTRIFSQDLDSRLTTDFSTRSKYAGASVTYGRNFRGFNTINMTYSFTDVENSQRQATADLGTDLLDGVQDGFFTVENNFKVSTVQPYWIRNTLDSRYEPSRGLMTSASVDVSGGILGGESSFVRPRLRGTWFMPVSRQRIKSSFGVHLEAGLIRPFDDSTLFAQQRFYLGGESSLRGFQNRSVTAREIGDEDGNGIPDEILRDSQGFPLGGESMINLKIEYHVVLGGPFRLVFYGDAGGVFTDAGNTTFLGRDQLFNDDNTPVLDANGNFVFETRFGTTLDQGFDLAALRYSVGAELRVQVPLFPAPLRFIFARNLNPIDGDNFKTFDFSLSTSF
jgi:outer membrane protein insertion porin family